MKLLVGLALSACAFAQSKPPADLAAVVRQLRLIQPQPDWQPTSAQFSRVQALLDAAIQLPGKVPAEAILPFAHLWLPEVLILLSRVPREAGVESALLEFREHATREADWVAATDLLFAANSHSFWPRIVRELRLKHDFLIDDRNAFRADYGSIGCGLIARRMAAGFPPMGVYQTIVNPEPGDVVLKLDPLQVYYRRTVVPTDGQAEIRDCDFHPAQVMRQFHLARILGWVDSLSPREADARFLPETYIRWQGSAEKAKAEIESLVSAQTAAVRTMLERMRSHGQFPADFAFPPIVVTVRDIRRDRSVPVDVPAQWEVSLAANAGR